MLTAPRIGRTVGAAVSLAAAAALSFLPFGGSGIAAASSQNATHILRTLQGGISYAQGAAALAQQPAVGVSFVDSAHGWAIAGCGYNQFAQPSAPVRPLPCSIIATSDGGWSWRTELTTQAQLIGIRFPAPTTDFAWTSPGTCPATIGTCGATVLAREGTSVPSV